MPTQYIAGANTTAQWYQDEYPGASVFSHIDKGLIHTTETGGWPGYAAGASAPNATYYPKWRQIRQHFGINRSSRALRDPSSTAVRENRDNVFQLEVICYSQYSLAVERGGLWVGDLTTNHMRDIAAIFLQCHRDWGLPLTSSVQWREGRKIYYNDVRLTGSQFDAYRGILGHVHASGNDHWDPGGFRYSRLEDALSYQLVNHPIYGKPVPIPDPPPPDPFEPEPIVRKAPDMIMLKQIPREGEPAPIWLIDGQVRRHVKTWSAAQALAAAGIPLDTEHPISSELLRSLTPQPQGPDVTDA